MTIVFNENVINYNNVTRIFSKYVKGSNPYYNVCIYDIGGNYHEIRYEIDEKDKLEKELKQLYF